MRPTALVAAFVVLPVAGTAAAEEPAAKALLDLHRSDAEGYSIFLDEAAAARAKFIEEPVYLWSNPTRSNGQTGAVFVWADGDGRPAAVGTIFSHPEDGRRVVCHEFHALARSVIYPRRAAADEPARWQPAAGVPTRPLADAPRPAETGTARLLQARASAREFEAESRDERGETWQLRLLPKPLAVWGGRDDADKAAGGALFAFVTSAGTDPEIALLLEVRPDDGKPRWEFSAARFSDLDLHLRRGGREVWNSIRDGENVWNRNADSTFRFDRDRVVDELPAAAAVPEDER